MRGLSKQVRNSLTQSVDPVVSVVGLAVRGSGSNSNIIKKHPLGSKDLGSSSPTNHRRPHASRGIPVNFPLWPLIRLGFERAHKLIADPPSRSRVRIGTAPMIGTRRMEIDSRHLRRVAYTCAACIHKKKQICPLDWTRPLRCAWGWLKCGHVRTAFNSPWARVE